MDPVGLLEAGVESLAIDEMGVEHPSETAELRREQVEGLLTGVRALFRGLNAREGRHLTRALTEEHFPFEAAQAELEACFRRLGLVLERMLGTLQDVLTEPEHEQLEELAFLARHAPITRPAELASIRAAAAA